MPTAKSLSPTALVAVLSISCGVGISAFFSPKNEYFLGNFAYFWLPQGAIVGVLLLRRAHLAMVAGCAFVLAGYLAAFGAWTSTLSGREALVWLVYFFSLPGAALGILVADSVGAPRIVRGPIGVGLFAALLTLIGLCINLAFMCAAATHCPV